MSGRTLKANYPGRCPDCSQHYRAGTTIRQLTDDKGKSLGWGHDKCPPVKAPETATVKSESSVSCDTEPTEPTASYADRWARFVPSEYQAELRRAFIETERHLVVRAVAGSGKTTSLCWLLATSRPGRTIFLAFNKSIATELRVKLPPTVEASTLNATGHRLVSHVLRRKLDPEAGLAPIYRQMWRVDDTDAGRRNKDLEGAVLHLCSLARGALLEPSQANLALLSQRHEVEGFYVEPYEVTQRVNDVLNEHVKRARDGRGPLACDFDSQIWLPYALNLAPIITYDTVLVDEAQDLNAAQHDLVMRLAGANGRVVAIGDPNQAIYGFRGANVTSMDDLTSRLAATTRGVETKPLSVCYRCPSKVIKLVQATGYCPGIEAAPNASEGEVFVRDESELVKLVREGATHNGREDDWCRIAVLSPLNAPLVPGVLKLVREGIPACIQGRDVSRSLRAIIDRVERKCSDDRIESFLKHLMEAKSAAIAKATARNENTETVCDVYDTISALCDAPDCETINDLRGWLDKVFVKADIRAGEKVATVVFSTVHRFKGQEREHILILRPDALPFPWARQDWEQQQARNLAYVAFTRAQERLVFLTLKTAPLHPRTAQALAAIDKPTDPTEPPPGGGGLNPPEGMLPPYDKLMDGTWDPCPGAVHPSRINDISRQACADLADGAEVEDAPEDAPSEEYDAPEAEPVDVSEPTARQPNREDVVYTLPTHPTKGDGVYTPPTLEDWKALVSEYQAAGCEAELIKPDGWRQMAMIVQRGARMVRVSTTVNNGASEARGKGANAIDICLVERPNGYPIGGRKKVLRTDGWKGRVCERINSLLVRGLVTS